jgi:hypothetical protein
MLVSKSHLPHARIAPRYFHLAPGVACALLESRIYPVLDRRLAYQWDRLNRLRPRASPCQEAGLVDYKSKYRGLWNVDAKWCLMNLEIPPC